MQETVTISKKEYELLKKHQKEYGILLDVLAKTEKFMNNAAIEARFIKSLPYDDKNVVLSLAATIVMSEIGKEFKERLKENDTKF
jgi:hypothetical protein